MLRDPNQENFSRFALWLMPKISFLIFLHTWPFWNPIHHMMKIFKCFFWFTNFLWVGIGVLALHYTTLLQNMCVQFTSPSSLDQWIHYFFTSPHSL
jgi:hypothetical protein